MLKVPKLDLTASQHSMGPIPVMVIAESPIVNHSRDVRMVVVVRSVVITVRVNYQSQAYIRFIIYMCLEHILQYAVYCTMYNV